MDTMQCVVLVYCIAGIFCLQNAWYKYVDGIGGAPGAYAPKTGGARDATSLAAREGLSGPS